MMPPPPELEAQRRMSIYGAMQRQRERWGPILLQFARQKQKSEIEWQMFTASEEERRQLQMEILRQNMRFQREKELAGMKAQATAMQREAFDTEHRPILTKLYPDLFGQGGLTVGNISELSSALQIGGALEKAQTQEAESEEFSKTMEELAPLVGQYTGNAAIGEAFRHATPKTLPVLQTMFLRSLEQGRGGRVSVSTVARDLERLEDTPDLVYNRYGLTPEQWKALPTGKRKEYMRNYLAEEYAEARQVGQGGGQIGLGAPQGPLGVKGVTPPGWDTAPAIGAPTTQARPPISPPAPIAPPTAVTPQEALSRVRMPLPLEQAEQSLRTYMREVGGTPTKEGFEAWLNQRGFTLMYEVP